MKQDAARVAQIFALPDARIIVHREQNPVVRIALIRAKLIVMVAVKLHVLLDVRVVVLVRVKELQILRKAEDSILEAVRRNRTE